MQNVTAYERNKKALKKAVNALLKYADMRNLDIEEASKIITKKAIKKDKKLTALFLEDLGKIPF